MPTANIEIIWTEYLVYRANMRGFHKNVLEKIVRFSTERYYDTSTRRSVVIGKHDTRLVMIPYNLANNTLTPVTVHSTTRQQLRFRLKTGRFVCEQA